MERKETFVNAILVLFAISLLAAPILYLKSRINPSGIESNLKPSHGVKNDSGSNKSPLVESKSASVTEKGQNITITLNEKGEIFINDIKCALSGLKFEISKLNTKQMEEQVVFLKADASVSYGNVMEVSAEIKKAGIKKIELAAEPASLTKSDHLDDAAVPKQDDSKGSQGKEPEVSKQLPKIAVVKEGRPKTIYTTVSDTEEENGKKATGSLKLTKASRTSSLKTTEKKQIPSKIIGETKKKAEEKRNSRKDQINTQNVEREALEKVNKAERKKETSKQNTSAKNQIQIQMGGKKYVVKKGETLWRISKRFDTSVQELRAANKLKDNKIRYDMVLIVPIGKEEPQDTMRASERKNTNNFMKDIKIADWSLYVAWGMPTLHHVTIENTGNTTYSNIQIKVLYYYSYSTDSAKLATAEVEGILPITVAAYSKKTYLQKGITLKQGSASSMFGGTKEITIIGATPVMKDGKLLSFN
jgi:biopolymer transport protein ExbD